MNAAYFRQLRNQCNTPAYRQQYRTIRALSGPMRYRILTILRAAPQGLTISEMARVFRVSLSRISHQMRILESARLVKGNRDAFRTRYQFAVPARYSRYFVQNASRFPLT